MNLLDTLPHFIEASDIGMLRVGPGGWTNVYVKLDDVRELIAEIKWRNICQEIQV